MKRKASVAALLLGILTLSLTFSTPSYAKLVVLSYGFNNTTEGFTSSTSSGCGANFTVTTSASGLVATSATATQCAGTFQIDKLVVLSSSVNNPSLDVTVSDTSNSLNNNGTVSINANNSNLHLNNGNGHKNGNAGVHGTVNGQVRIKVSVQFNQGARSFVINNVSLSSN